MKAPFFVAELSANHLGEFKRALALVDIAAAAGANGFKLQTYDPERLVGDHAYVIPDGPWKGQRLLTLYKRAATPRAWHAELFSRARELGMVPFSSPFSPEDVAFLEGLNCEIYKIASFEIVDLDLIRAAAETRKRLIISTGMATLAEIERAVEMAWKYGRADVTLLKCTSAYPATLEEANLACIPDLKSYFSEGVEVGLSDHTLGWSAAAAATALGATVIEKHLITSLADGGPDAEFSAVPVEFSQMVHVCEQIAAAVGQAVYGPTLSEKAHVALRRSLWVVRGMQRGDVLTRENLRACRPADGEPCARLEEFLGRKVNCPLGAGTPFHEGYCS